MCRRTGWALALSILGVCTGWAHAGRAPVADAKELLYSGQVQEAQRLLEERLSVEPDDPQAIDVWIDSLTCSQDRDRGLSHFEEARTARRDAPGPLLGLGLYRMAASEWDEALALLEQAGTRYAQAGSKEGTILCRGARGLALLQTGELPQGETALMEAIDMAAGSGQNELEWEFRCGLADAHLAREREEVLRILDWADRSPEALVSSPLWVRILDLKADALAFGGKETEAAPLYEKALAVARERGLRHAEASTLLGTGSLAVYRADPERGRDLLRQARAVVSEDPCHDLNDLESVVLLSLAAVEARTGHAWESEDLFREALRKAVAPEAVTRVHTALSRFRLEQGRLEEALSLASSALDVRPAGCADRDRLRALHAKSLAVYSMREWVELRRAAGEALEIASELSDRDEETTARALLADAAAARGDLDEAAVAMAAIIDVPDVSADPNTLMALASGITRMLLLDAPIELTIPIADRFAAFLELRHAAKVESFFLRQTGINCVYRSEIALATRYFERLRESGRARGDEHDVEFAASWLEALSKLPKGDPPGEIRRAIESMRGIDPHSLKTRQAERKNENLDAAWRTIMLAGEAGRQALYGAIRQELASPQKDSYFLLDAALLASNGLAESPHGRLFADVLTSAKIEDHYEAAAKIAHRLARTWMPAYHRAVVPILSLPTDMRLNVKDGELTTRDVLTFVFGRFGSDVAPIVRERLASGNPEEVRNTLLVTSLLADRAAIPAVRALLGATESDVRALATRTLGELGDLESIPVLESRMAEDDTVEAVAAARGLSAMGAPAVVGMLVRCLGDARGPVAQACADGLVRYHTPEAVQALSAWLGPTTGTRELGIIARGVALYGTASESRALAKSIEGLPSFRRTLLREQGAECAVHVAAARSSYAPFPETESRLDEVLAGQDCGGLARFASELRRIALTQAQIDRAEEAAVAGTGPIEREQRTVLGEMTPAALEKWAELDSILDQARLVRRAGGGA